MIQISSLQMP